MKISKLILKNIKCFKEVEISFEDNNEIKNWSLLSGDNGQGKTTILRSLAIGLCDKEGASALLAELHGGFLRHEEKEGFIEVFLKDDTNKEYTIKTEIVSDGNNETISQPKGLAKESREDIFAVAYGSGRTIRGTESYEEYALVDSLYTLFNYEFGLQNVELGARRIYSESEKEWKKLENILKEILTLDDNDKITLEKKGLYVETKKWRKMSFNSLSDGYQSLTSVILDFLSWKLLSSDTFNLDEISGIVIIDEIEQHLHPRWQRSIIKSLSDKFPKVQFICSTHTPICVLGLADLEEGEPQLIKASYVNGHSDTESFDLKRDFRGYRVDQILTSDIFDLSDTRNKRTEGLLKEYKDIYLKETSSRTEEEKNRLKKIESELGELPMWDHEKDRKRVNELIQLLKK